MEQVKHPGKWSFVLVWGVFWGVGTALLETLFDWYRTRHLDSFPWLVGRLVIFMAVGSLCGLVLHEYRRSLVPKKPTRARVVTRFVFFVALMLGLAYVLWTTARS